MSLDTIIADLTSKSTVVGTVAGHTITAGNLETSVGTLGTFVTKFEAAVKAKNYESVAELTLEEVATIADDVGVPYAGIAEVVIPLLFDLANIAISSFRADLASGKIMPDGRGGYVPAGNSHYDAKTGLFLDGPFSEASKT
jgi:hypothetical protein